MNRLVKFSLYILVISFIAIIAVVFQITYFGKTAKPEKSDCIIVLGCSVYGTVPSPFLTWRTEEALKLYNKGYGQYIIVSGGKGPGEDISEAEAMKRYLTLRGVDPSKIIKEDKSGSTMANLINSKAIMKKENFHTAVIVSNKFHLKRAALMAKDQGINASFSGVFVETYKYHEFIGYIREIPALAKYYILKVGLK